MESCLKKVLLFQYDICAHKSCIVIYAMRDLGSALLEHLPYSLDLTPSNYYAFQQLKNSLNGSKFRFNGKEIKWAQYYELVDNKCTMLLIKDVFTNEL